MCELLYISSILSRLYPSSSVLLFHRSIGGAMMSIETRACVHAHTHTYCVYTSQPIRFLIKKSDRRRFSIGLYSVIIFRRIFVELYISFCVLPCCNRIEMSHFEMLICCDWRIGKNKHKVFIGVSISIRLHTKSKKITKHLHIHPRSANKKIN